MTPPTGFAAGWRRLFFGPDETVEARAARHLAHHRQLDAEHRRERDQHVVACAVVAVVVGVPILFVILLLVIESRRARRNP